MSKMADLVDELVIPEPLARQSDQFDELQVNERLVSKDMDSVPEDNNQGCLLVSTSMFHKWTYNRTHMNMRVNPQKNYHSRL